MQNNLYTPGEAQDASPPSERRTRTVAVAVNMSRATWAGRSPGTVRQALSGRHVGAASDTAGAQRPPGDRRLAPRPAATIGHIAMKLKLDKTPASAERKPTTTPAEFFT
jgi:hypothetical protein